ncbi:hypothetical protein SK128_015064 [Halocaridina rubra]|uniref:Uncharacterized protein n=1 Tax=Halocaridina rubra TaxID=373956 RepID=A0AAN8XCB1_HALRR
MAKHGEYSFPSAHPDAATTQHHFRPPRTPAVNKTIPSTATPKTNVNNKNGSARRNSEGYDEEDNEDIGEEDYLSDASLDSKRLMKEDAGGQSYMRYRTTGTAEGKFREAMYHRVRNELCLMRQNSIRFSRGLVNYARQMVETKTRKYSESFLEFFQKWARELGILEMLTTMEEEMRGRRFLAKPLVLVRVLIEVLLASLLRQVRGKRSRRTRSMRSESLRRRAQQSLSGMTNPLPLSPAALQQSSEPAQHPQLSVQPALRPTVLKEEERDLDGFLSKDSALGSEDNHSEECESDQTISPNDEGPESDSDMERQRRRSYDSSNSPAFKGSLDRIDENDVSDNGEPSSLENNQIVDANLLNADEHKPNSQSKKGKSSKQKLRFNPQL